MSVVYNDNQRNAIVFDPGRHSLRVGYAGERRPRSFIPAVVGMAPATHIPESEEKIPDGNIAQNGSNSGSQWCLYVNAPHIFEKIPGMEIETYMEKRQIHNWELFEKVLDYCYDKILSSSPDSHPVIFTEPIWPSMLVRLKLHELLFEKYQVPSIFVTSNVSLVPVAYEKLNAIVVDVGMKSTVAVPVVKSEAVEYAAVMNMLGGDDVVMEAEQMLSNLNVEMVPLYSIQKELYGSNNEEVRYTPLSVPSSITDSWKKYIMKRQYEFFCHSIAQVPGVQYNKYTPAVLPGPTYTFANGYSHKFGPERFKLGEAMFRPKVSPSDLACYAARKCKPEQQALVCKDIVCCGGGTCMNGWLERFARDLTMRVPFSQQLEIHAAPNLIERQYAAWLGGSMIGMSETLREISDTLQDYNERGGGIILTENL